MRHWQHSRPVLTLTTRVAHVTLARRDRAGNSNQSVEAAREAGMAAVVVAGRVPVYELTAADLVVRQLDELSFVNLKQLFRNEELAALNVRTGS